MGLSKYISIVFFSLMIQTFSFAQCDQVGQVVNANAEGCALLIQLDNGDLIEPVNSLNYNLTVGATIQFDYETPISGLACSGNLPIELTCVQEATMDPNCTADFLWFISPNVNPVIAFQPVAVGTGTYTFSWDFGDGTISTDTMPSHHYSASGLYEVCLTVTGEGDCLVTHCETIYYTYVNPESCNFGINLQVEGLTVTGTIFSYVDFGPYQPQEVRWFNHTTGALLSENPDFTHTFSDADEVQIISAIFTVTYPDGNTCEGTIFQPVILENLLNNCDVEDCVYPGDANKDGASNYLDALLMSVGYGWTGPAREADYIGSKWAPAPAQDWGLTTANGVDFKHLDGNGDGTINDADIAIIRQNYMPSQGDVSPTVEGHPNIWLEFLDGSIIIDEDSPEQIEIFARVMVGESPAPITDLYGLAFQLSYPGEMVVPYSAEIVYNEACFLGTSDEIISLQQDLGSLGWGLLDATFSRKNQINVTGAGNIATVKFIVDSDIIGGRAEPEIDFSIGIEKVKMINHQGLEKAANVPAQPATIRIINTLQNSTNNPKKEERVTIFPNPVDDVLTIKLEYLEGERLEVYNTVGQLIQTQTIVGNLTNVLMDRLPSGVYWVKVYTEKGAVSQRVFVE